MDFIWLLRVHFLDQMSANYRTEDQSQPIFVHGAALQCNHIRVCMVVGHFEATVTQLDDCDQRLYCTHRACYLTFYSKTKPHTGSPECPEPLHEQPKCLESHVPVKSIPRPTSQERGNLNMMPSQHEKGWRGRLDPTLLYPPPPRV